ncbi:Ca(2+)-dependent cysteine protease [Nowakowskiella sp. JEL0407]|nr:Ca(2+)-dependent cysteine protease [Nowakowskiella sp. JEL0407]
MVRVAGSSCTGTKKAMFVGINYFGTSSKLSGCINDVKNVKAFITRNYGFREDPNLMLTLTDDQQGWQFRPTRANIIAGIRWLVQGARPGDSLFFHFSGHGSQQKDHDGDEDDGYDETICPLDYQTAGMITDDELNQMLVRPLPAGVRLTCVVDSCHSGSVLDLPFMYLPDGTVKDASLLKKAGGLALGVGMKMLKRDKIGAAMQLFQGVSQLATGGNSKKMEGQKGSPADVFMFSGCKDSQTSADTYKQGVGSTGAMSYSLLKALGTNPRQTYAQLLGAVRDILRNEYQQIPQMSTAHLTDMNQPFNM